LLEEDRLLETRKLGTRYHLK